MPLTESQFKILHAIKLEADSTSNSVVESRKIAERTGFDLDTILYHLDNLVQEDYIRANIRQLDFRGSLNNPTAAYLVELRHKGRVAIAHPEEIVHPAASIANQTFNLQGAEGVTVISGNYNTTNITNNINQHISEIIESIKSLHTLIVDFPEEEREAASIYLSNLEEEVKLKSKRDPKKINFYLRKLRGIGLVTAALVAGSVAFTDQVMGIAQKLGYSLEINHSKPPEQLPPSP